MKFAGAKTKRAVQNFEQYRLDASQTANALDGLVSEIGKKAEEEGITRKQVFTHHMSISSLPRNLLD